MHQDDRFTIHQEVRGYANNEHKAAQLEIQSRHNRGNPYVDITIPHQTLAVRNMYAMCFHEQISSKELLFLFPNRNMAPKDRPMEAISKSVAIRERMRKNLPANPWESLTSDLILYAVKGKGIDFADALRLCIKEYEPTSLCFPSKSYLHGMEFNTYGTKVITMMQSHIGANKFAHKPEAGETPVENEALAELIFEGCEIKGLDLASMNVRKLTFNNCLIDTTSLPLAGLKELVIRRSTIIDTPFDHVITGSAEIKSSILVNSDVGKMRCEKLKLDTKVFSYIARGELFKAGPTARSPRRLDSEKVWNERDPTGKERAAMATRRAATQELDDIIGRKSDTRPVTNDVDKLRAQSTSDDPFKFITDRLG